MSTNSSAFNELRPLCIDLSRLSFQPKEAFDPQSSNLRDALWKLEAKLALYDDESFQPKLADYIFVPISSLLKQTSLGEAQSSYVLLILSHLLRLSWRKNGTLNEDLAQQLLPLLTFLISRDVKNEILDNVSQDCKRAGGCALFQFTKSLAQQSYSRAFFSANNSRNLTAMAHSISALLTILEQSSKDSGTQLMILDTLQILYCDVIGDGELLSFIVPGNISSFTKVLMMPGMTTNYRVILKTLDIMKHLILLVYDDLSLNVHRKRITDIKELRYLNNLNDETLKLDVVSIEEPYTNGQKIHRSTSWMRGTSSQIKLALERIVPKLQKRNNMEISQKLVDVASDFLSRCTGSLHNCEKLLVDVLMQAGTDSQSQLLLHTACLRDLLRDRVSNIGSRIQFQDLGAIRSLNYGLASLMDIDSVDDALLAGDLCRSILSVIQSVVEIATLKKFGNGVLEQSSNVVIAESLKDEIVELRTLPAIFPNISKETEESLSHLIMTTGRLASKYNQITSIIEALLSDQSSQNITTRAIALWLSSQMTLGLQDSCPTPENAYLNLDSTEPNKEPCYDILDSCNGLFQEVLVSAQGKAMSKASEISLTVIISSIESSCDVLGSEFSSELVDYLYIVVENLASPSPTIRQYAQSCSLKIAHILYNDSIREMILANVDYLADSISSRLNCGLTERVSTVFMVICKLAGYETIECFGDIIETIFKILDYYHGYDSMCLEFFQLFEVIILEIQKRYYSANTSGNRIAHHDQRHRAGSPWGMTNIQQVLAIMDKERSTRDDLSTAELPEDPKNFQEYFDSKLRVVDSDDEEEDEAEEDTSNASPKEENEWVSPVPRESYKILLQILGYGDRLLTHRSKPLKVQILRVTSLMVPMLASQYSSFLPQVAQIWDTLVLCSLEEDLSVVKPAGDCLRELIHYAGDFITTRFLELWKAWQAKSVLLRELKLLDTRAASTSIILHKKFPTITQSALNSLAQVLIEGIIVSGLTVPDLTSREMIFFCIQVLPPQAVAARSMAIADIVQAMIQDV